MKIFGKQVSIKKFLLAETILVIILIAVTTYYYSIVFKEISIYSKGKSLTISEQGSLGSAIGGYIAPITSLVTIVIVSMAFLAQASANSILRKTNKDLLANDFLQRISNEINIIEGKDMHDEINNITKTIQGFEEDREIYKIYLSKLNYSVNNFVYIYNQIELFSGEYKEMLFIKLSSIFNLRYKVRLCTVVAGIDDARINGRINVIYEKQISQLRANITFLLKEFDK